MDKNRSIGTRDNHNGIAKPDVYLHSVKKTNLTAMEPPEITPPASAPPPVISTSLASRLFNIIATPGEVFDEVRTSAASAGNWVVPVFLSILAGIAFSLVVFSQPAIVQQIHDAQDQKLDQLVKEGKMPQEKADQAKAAMEKFTGPTVLAISGVVGSVVASFVRIFWWAFILWLGGRLMLRVRVPYMKAVEVTGLTMMITVLGAVVALLMVVSFGKLSATPSLGVMVDHFDFSNRSHLALGAVNLFTLWFVAVISLGLARLSQDSAGKAAIWIFGYFVAYELFWILVGPFINMGQMAL